MSDDIRKYIKLVEQTLIPLPNSLKVEVSAYEFVQLMSEFRGLRDAESRGDTGLVTFYSDEELAEFENFLRKNNVSFKQIGVGNK